MRARWKRPSLVEDGTESTESTGSLTTAGKAWPAIDAIELRRRSAMIAWKYKILGKDLMEDASACKIRKDWSNRQTRTL